MTVPVPDLRRTILVVAGFAALVAVILILGALAGAVRYTYSVRTVALGGALLGAISGFIGSFAVLRKQSLLGDALSHAALPGVAAAFLLAGRDLGVLLIGAGIASWLGVLFVRAVVGTTRIKEDTAMGVVLTAWFAAGIVGLTYIQGRPDASQAGLDTFIFGQAAAIVRSDIRLLTLLSAIAVVTVVAFWKQFKLVTFNPEFAAANGIRVALWNGILSLLLVVAIVMGLQLAGVILMVGMLIAPGVAARQWTDRLEAMVVLAAVFGAGSGIIGAVLSAVDANLPTGPMIIVVAFAVVGVSVFLAPTRGILWTGIRRIRDARRFAARTVLRDIYHYAFDHDGPTGAVPDSFIAGVRGRRGRRALRRLLGGGFVRRVEEAAGVQWYLTDEGLRVAREDARNQRLWDLYREMGDRLGLPRVPEERERDIRAVLDPTAVDALAEFLQVPEGEPCVRG